MEVADNIRPEHFREAQLLLGGYADPRRVVDESARKAKPLLAGIRDGKTLFIFGVGRVCAMTGTAAGWLIGTPEMDRHGVWIADVSWKMLPVLHGMSGAAVIANSVPADYGAALRWLKWLGFRMEPPHEYAGMDAANQEYSAQLSRATKTSPWMAATTTALDGATAMAQRYGYDRKFYSRVAAAHAAKAPANALKYLDREEVRAAFPPGKWKELKEKYENAADNANLFSRAQAIVGEGTSSVRIMEEAAKLYPDDEKKFKEVVNLSDNLNRRIATDAKNGLIARRKELWDRWGADKYDIPKMPTAFRDDPDEWEKALKFAE